jgi:hypothetical protein
VIEVSKNVREYETCTACDKKAAVKVSFISGNYGTSVKLCEACLDELYAKITAS